MASSKYTSLKDSLTRVWERRGFNAESALQPIHRSPASGPLAGLPGLYTCLHSDVKLSKTGSKKQGVVLDSIPRKPSPLSSDIPDKEC